MNSGLNDLKANIVNDPNPTTLTYLRNTSFRFQEDDYDDLKALFEVSDTNFVMFICAMCTFPFISAI